MTPATASSSTCPSPRRRSTCSPTWPGPSTRSDEAEVDGECVFVRPQSKSSGLGAITADRGMGRGRRRTPTGHLVARLQRLGRHPRPAPDRAGRRADRRRGHAVHAHAAGHRHAPADGRGPRLARTSPSASPTSSSCPPSGEGWAAFGHPEWGPFRLGKTNPNFSTSGLSALIAQSYAATGKTEGLTTEDLAQQEVIDFATGVESAVVHYGDTTLTFLNNLLPGRPAGQRPAATPRPWPSRRSRSSTTTGATPTASSSRARSPARPGSRWWPSTPRRARSTRTTRSSSSTPSGSPTPRPRAPSCFSEFVQEADNQERVLDYGFRPGNPAVAIGEPDRPPRTASTPTSPRPCSRSPSRR